MEPERKTASSSVTVAFFGVLAAIAVGSFISSIKHSLSGWGAVALALAAAAIIVACSVLLTRSSSSSRAKNDS